MMLNFLVLMMAFFGSVLSGLFGGGAGLIFTPAIYLFLSYNYPQANHLMQTSITTMIASMLLSGLVVCFKQHHYKQIDWIAVRWSAPYITAGSIFGCFTMTLVSSKTLTYFFAITTLLLALKSWLAVYRQSLARASTHRNGSYVRRLSAFGLGVLSTVSGSASFVVPFYEHFGLSIKSAIGSTTVSVWIYSIFVTVFMVLSGLSQTDLPAGNVGYLNYHYLWLFMIPTIPGAMVGAKLSHYLPENKLKLGFSLLLTTIGVSMLFS
jgi:uncharacterized membrane protein YfcA